jgi:hypothetical protein
MSIFGKISGRTAGALLPEEKNAEYRALGAERLGATGIVDIRGDLVCISTDVEQGMRTDGKSDHIAASQLDRDSCAAMEARLAHQLTSLSDRF